MAYQPDLKKLLAQTGRKRFTPDTITERRRLAGELEKIKRVGIAFSSGERVPGAAGLAAPIFSIDGSVRACLSIYGPKSRLNGTTMVAHREPLVAAARRIGSRLAGRDGVDQIGEAIFVTPTPAAAASRSGTRR
jgi:DNA-binding IclR family transcriptional regulator